MTRIQALLAWYRTHRRALPWRAAPGAQQDPYATLVSELMLQQTRVATVIPYFVRWMQRWPTLGDLAKASEQEVRAMWTGLGYYRRATNLLAAAQQAQQLHGGLPRDHAALLQLKGVGPYTAGAVASIGHGLAEALVDGNVARVLARWYAIDVDVRQGAGRRLVWARAETLMLEKDASDDPGSWNQALMELGATVCAASRPLCATCPVSRWCEARRQGVETTIPVARKRKVPKRVDASYVVVMRGDHVLLGRRPETGRWAGLWEPPGAEGPRAESLARDAITTFLRAHAPAQQLQWPPQLATIRHLLTHRDYRVIVRRLDVEPVAPGPLQLPDYAAAQWLHLDDALGRAAGVSRLGQRVIEAAL